MDILEEAIALALPTSPPAFHSQSGSPERAASESSCSSWSMLNKMRNYKGPDQEPLAKRPLNLLELPVDILKEIIAHVSWIALHKHDKYSSA